MFVLHLHELRAHSVFSGVVRVSISLSVHEVLAKCRTHLIRFAPADGKTQSMCFVGTLGV
jgi:hypothetical protein